MRHEVSLRDINQHLPQYVKAVEAGEEIIITRRGVPVVRMTAISAEKTLTKEQQTAKTRLLALMRKGLNLGGHPPKRDDLHAR